jgi:hypothetical protein
LESNRKYLAIGTSPVWQIMILAIAPTIGIGICRFAYARSLACVSGRLTNALCRRESRQFECLSEARPTQRFYIVLALSLVHRHLTCHPGKRDVGLHTANLLDHGRGEVVVT